MTRADWGLAIFGILLLGVIAYIIVGLAGVVSEIVAALIGLGGVILGSVIRYTSELEKNRKDRLQKLQQENYQELFRMIGFYAQDKEKGRIPLTVAHIESWAFADKEVVEETNKFLEEPSKDNLANLLVTIRKTSELDNLDMKKVNVKTLFPKTSEGLD